MTPQTYVRQGIPLDEFDAANTKGVITPELKAQRVGESPWLSLQPQHLTCRSSPGELRMSAVQRHHPNS